MFVNSDFSDLLQLFNDNQVRYLVIGGYAYIQYAEPRYTKDLDLWIEFDKAWTNREEIDLDGLSVAFISKEDLIVSKRASGRAQDLLDANVLSQADS